jgi:hypothetical protein
MARTDIYLDAMLRHLGAAYYESLHARATRSDVTRVPVLTMGRHVAGVVSEADLIAAEDTAARKARMHAAAGRRRLLRRTPR